jgi:hypothetical protein
MSDRIQLDADLLSQHAARVDQVAAGVRTASNAADSMDIGGGAFGLMCAFLVPAALITTTAAKMAIDSTESLLTRSARELRGAVADFSAYEVSVADATNRLRDRLELDAP